MTVGAYLAVMQVLGLESDLSLVAQADPMGRSLQDSRLGRRDTRASRCSRRATWAPRTEHRLAASQTRARRPASAPGRNHDVDQERRIREFQGAGGLDGYHSEQRKPGKR